MTVNLISPELAGRRGFILHDHQSADANFYPRVWEKCQTLPPSKWFGLPETEKCGDSAFEKMNEDWQFFWFDLLRHYFPIGTPLATVKKKWADLTHSKKAFTNKHGTDIYADYVLRKNLSKQPAAQENVTCGGNMVVLSGNKKNIGGAPFVGVLCLDRSFKPPIILGHQALDCFVHSATVCRPEKILAPIYPRCSIAPNGRFLVNNFDHTGGRKVPVPFVSARGVQSVFMGLHVRENWIRADRICKLDDDEFPPATVW